MLDYILTGRDGVKTKLESVVSAVINSDVDVPADDITLLAMFDAGIAENADTVTAMLGDKVIFRGQIDEIVNLFSQKAYLTKITARSFAGKLLDNEAEPVVYNNPTDDFIFSRHLKPFGITMEDSDKAALFGMIKIDKGMSHWQVLENFCAGKYGAFPRITGDGRVLFSGYKNSEPVRFGNDSGEIPFIRLEEDIKRFELISEVKIKSKTNERYTSHINNDNPECRGIERVRYVNVSNDRDTLETADRLIENSNSKGYGMVLECPGFYGDIIGRRAVVNFDEIDCKQSLVVKKIRYSSNNSLESTVITLKKER